MNNSSNKTKFSGALIAFLLVGLLFSLTVAAETDENVAVSAVGTNNGVEFRVQDQGIESFSLSVFTPNGKQLFKSGTVSDSVSWNLTDSSGNRVPFGIYLYQFVGQSSTGDVATRGVAKIFVGPSNVTAESVKAQKLNPMKGGPPAGVGNAKGVIKVTEGESIQDAIDDANDGDIIRVYEGTYKERIRIDGKDLKLVAQGDVTIEEPNPDETQWEAAISTVRIENSRTTIEGFTIDVQGGWSGIYAIGGPYYGNGEVEVTVKNNTVVNYNRNGITVNGEKASGKIVGNEVVGEIDDGWANNGIQLANGASGLVKDNMVKKNIWTGEGNWTATAILLYDVDHVQVMNNLVEEGQMGIGVLGTNNKIVNNNLETGSWGIAVYSGENNKVIHNEIEEYENEIWDGGEDSKVHANVYPEE